MAYFIDSMGDLLKKMFEGMGLKELTKRALDRKLPIEVRLRVVDIMVNYGEECVAHLEKVAKKGDGEVAAYAARRLAELRAGRPNSDGWRTSKA